MGNAIVHFEVIGPDRAALVKFYGELFGWHIQDMPEMNYAMVDTHGGSGINGGIGDMEDARFVAFYIEVPDTDAALAAIEKAGGKTVVPTTEIPNVVTFAQFTDPDGNRVGLVKGDGSEQGGVSAGDTPEVGWFEVIGKDGDELAKFYTGLFGWKTKRNEMGGGVTYHEVDPQAGGRGTQGGIGGAFPGQSGHATVYAGVDDVTKTLERAESLGGKTVMPETKVAEETIIGLFADPAGNTFGVYKRMPR